MLALDGSPAVSFPKPVVIRKQKTTNYIAIATPIVYLVLSTVVISTTTRMATLATNCVEWEFGHSFA